MIPSVRSENKPVGSKPKKANIDAGEREKKASWHGYVPHHAGCRITMRLTQNNNVTVMQTIRRLRCRIVRFWYSVTGPLEAGHTEAKSRDSAYASDDARFHSNLRIRRCKIAKNRSMSHRPASCDFHRLILHQAILVWFFERLRTGYAWQCQICPYVPCLTTPVLPALLFRREVECRFFFLCFDHGWLFLRNPIKEIKNVSWRVFSKRQSGPASFRIPDRPMSTSTGAEWSCARNVLAMIPSVRSENKPVGSKPKKANIDAGEREKKPVDMVTFPTTLDAESPWGWPKTTMWPWCKRSDEILRCRIVRFWYSVTGPLFLQTKWRFGQALFPTVADPVVMRAWVRG